MSRKAFIYYQVDNIESVIVSAVPPLHIKNHDLKLFHLHDLNGLIAETNAFIVSIHARGRKERCLMTLSEFQDSSLIFHGVKRLEEVN